MTHHRTRDTLHAWADPTEGLGDTEPAELPHTPKPQLVTRAELLYPASAYLQREWMRAVRLVRETARGWLLDRALDRPGRSK